MSDDLMRITMLHLLQDATRARRIASEEWERALERAISVGKFTEREIGRAAGISGPAVHHRKVAMREARDGGDRC